MIDRQEYSLDLVKHIEQGQAIVLLGREAVELLQRFGVGTSYRLDREALKLAALETVKHIARKKQLWSDIDVTMTDLRQKQSSSDSISQNLAHIQYLYEAAAERQTRKVRRDKIFAARDAAERFAGGYWRYPPQPHTHEERLLRQTLRQAGMRFRPFGKLVLGVESRLPYRIQHALAERRAQQY